LHVGEDRPRHVRSEPDRVGIGKQEMGRNDCPALNLDDHRHYQARRPSSPGAPFEPVKIFRRKGSLIYSYRGTVAGRRLRGSTGTTDKIRAEQIAARTEADEWKRRLDGPQAVLSFAKAAILYRASGKGQGHARQIKYLEKIEDYWKDTLVKEITAGAIRQSAIDIYPEAGNATRNRQVITPTQAIINHCAELELCPPIRIRRFKFEQKIKKPVTLDWLNTFCNHARPVIKALVLGMFATACRFNEARRLDWPDFDFTARTILIRDTKTRKERLANMPQPLLLALANLPRDKKPFHWSESQLRRFWDEDVAKTAEAVPGFERLTFHSCRHGFATKMLREGIDPKTAAKLGGWDDIGLFMKTYAHAMQDATLTDKLFDTDLTRPKTTASKNNGLQ
jgi:integrase